MNALEIAKNAYQRQVDARTRRLDLNNPEDKPSFDRAKKLAVGCLRMSDFPQLAELAPTAGEFEIEGFKIIRRKVDEIDNIYVSII